MSMPPTRQNSNSNSSTREDDAKLLLDFAALAAGRQHNSVCDDGKQNQLERLRVDFAAMDLDGDLWQKLSGSFTAMGIDIRPGAPTDTGSVSQEDLECAYALLDFARVRVAQSSAPAVESQQPASTVPPTRCTKAQPMGHMRRHYIGVNSM